MNAQVGTLTTRSENLASSARKAARDRNRPSALAALRSKKMVEATLSRRSEVLAQLEEVYSKIEQAADQVETVKVMEASAKVLKRLNSDVGGVEKVQDVVEELREEMDKVEDVGHAMNEIGHGEVMVNEGEIDDELEAMEREQRLEKEELESSGTMRRLHELTNVNDLRSPETGATAGRTQTASTMTGVEESIADLARMSMDEHKSTPDENNNQGDTSATQEATAPIPSQEA